MPQATVDVSCRLLEEALFKCRVRVVGVAGQSFIRFLIEGADLPEPLEDGTPRQVIATVTEDVSFHPIR